jgi:hypothetical protein
LVIIPQRGTLPVSLSGSWSDNPPRAKSFMKNLSSHPADHPREPGTLAPGLDVRKIGINPRIAGTLFSNMLVFTKVRIIPAGREHILYTDLQRRFRIIPASAGTFDTICNT